MKNESNRGQVNTPRLEGTIASNVGTFGLKRNRMFKGMDQKGKNISLTGFEDFGDTVVRGPSVLNSYVGAFAKGMVDTETGRFALSCGQAAPLGVSQAEKGINFALFSEHATSISLCL